MSRGLTMSVTAAVVLGATFGAWPLTRSVAAVAQTERTRTVVVAAVEKDGTPIADLTAADLEIKENGRAREITNVAHSTRPLRVHVIISDAGTGAFQLGLLQFARSLADRSEFAFTTVMVQPNRIMNFTSNPAAISDGLSQLGRRGSPQGAGQMMEAISEALKDIAIPGKHSVLIVLRLGGEGVSAIQPAEIRTALRTTSTTLYVMSQTGASRLNRPRPTSMSGEAMQQQNAALERADSAFDLNSILNDGSRESGGQHEEVALTSAVSLLQRLATEIKSRYEITYALAPDAKPGDRFQITTKRRNVTLRAPARVGN
jgi:hypothetical protein